MHGELPGAASAFLSVASRVEVATFFRYLREDVSSVDDDDLHAVFQLAFRHLPVLAHRALGRALSDDPEPMGLKRMTKEEWPDQWPAETTASAAALASDEGEVREIRPALKQTQLEKLALGCAYDAATHGWSARAFHTQLDGQGAAVLVGKTADGETFGGYNPIGWLGYGEARDAISAFLYVLDRKTGKAVKLPKTGGSGMAIIDEDGKGPQWGPDGLKISLEGRSARSRLGTYYETMPDGGDCMFANTKRGSPVELTELRVYVSLEDTEIAKNYQPNALQWQKGELEEIRSNDDDPNHMDGFFGKLFGKKK